MLVHARRSRGDGKRCDDDADEGERRGDDDHDAPDDDLPGQKSRLSFRSKLIAYSARARGALRTPQGRPDVSPLGLGGSSGGSTGPHLHYEILYNNNFIDPFSHPATAMIEGQTDNAEIIKQITIKQKNGSSSDRL